MTENVVKINQVVKVPISSLVSVPISATSSYHAQVATTVPTTISKVTPTNAQENFISNLKHTIVDVSRLYNINPSILTKQVAEKILSPPNIENLNNAYLKAVVNTLGKVYHIQVGNAIAKVLNTANLLISKLSNFSPEQMHLAVDVSRLYRGGEVPNFVQENINLASLAKELNSALSAGNISGAYAIASRLANTEANIINLTKEYLNPYEVIALSSSLVSSRLLSPEATNALHSATLYAYKRIEPEINVINSAINYINNSYINIRNRLELFSSKLEGKQPNLIHAYNLEAVSLKNLNNLPSILNELTTTYSSILNSYSTAVNAGNLQTFMGYLSHAISIYNLTGNVALERSIKNSISALSSFVSNYLSSIKNYINTVSNEVLSMPPNRFVTGLGSYGTIRNEAIQTIVNRLSTYATQISSLEETLNKITRLPPEVAYTKIAEAMNIASKAYGIIDAYIHELSNYMTTALAGAISSRNLEYLTKLIPASLFTYSITNNYLLGQRLEEAFNVIKNHYSNTLNIIHNEIQTYMSVLRDLASTNFASFRELSRIFNYLINNVDRLSNTLKRLNVTGNMISSFKRLFETINGIHNVYHTFTSYLANMVSSQYMRNIFSSFKNEVEAFSSRATQLQTELEGLKNTLSSLSPSFSIPLSGYIVSAGRLKSMVDNLDSRIASSSENLNLAIQRIDKYLNDPTLTNFVKAVNTLPELGKIINTLNYSMSFASSFIKDVRSFINTAMSTSNIVKGFSEVSEVPKVFSEDFISGIEDMARTTLGIFTGHYHSLYKAITGNLITHIYNMFSSFGEDVARLFDDIGRDAEAGFSDLGTLFRYGFDYAYDYIRQGAYNNYPTFSNFLAGTASFIYSLSNVIEHGGILSMGNALANSEKYEPIFRAMLDKPELREDFANTIAYAVPVVGSIGHLLTNPNESTYDKITDVATAVAEIVTLGLAGFAVSGSAEAGELLATALTRFGPMGSAFNLGMDGVKALYDYVTEKRVGLTPSQILASIATGYVYGIDAGYIMAGIGESISSVVKNLPQVTESIGRFLNLDEATVSEAVNTARSIAETLKSESLASRLIGAVATGGTNVLMTLPFTRNPRDLALSFATGFAIASLAEPLLHGILSRFGLTEKDVVLVKPDEVGEKAFDPKYTPAILRYAYARANDLNPDDVMVLISDERPSDELINDIKSQGYKDVIWYRPDEAIELARGYYDKLEGTEIKTFSGVVDRLYRDIASISLGTKDVYVTLKGSEINLDDLFSKGIRYIYEVDPSDYFRMEEVFNRAYRYTGENAITIFDAKIDGRRYPIISIESDSLIKPIFQEGIIRYTGGEGYLTHMTTAGIGKTFLPSMEYASPRAVDMMQFYASPSLDIGDGEVDLIGERNGSIAVLDRYNARDLIGSKVRLSYLFYTGGRGLKPIGRYSSNLLTSKIAMKTIMPEVYSNEIEDVEGVADALEEARREFGGVISQENIADFYSRFGKDIRMYPEFQELIPAEGESTMIYRIDNPTLLSDVVKRMLPSDIDANDSFSAYVDGNRVDIGNLSSREGIESFARLVSDVGENRDVTLVDNDTGKVYNIKINDTLFKNANNIYESLANNKPLYALYYTTRPLENVYQVWLNEDGEVKAVFDPESDEWVMLRKPVSYDPEDLRATINSIREEIADGDYLTVSKGGIDGYLRGIQRLINNGFDIYKDGQPMIRSVYDSPEGVMELEPYRYRSVLLETEKEGMRYIRRVGGKYSTRLLESNNPLAKMLSYLYGSNYTMVKEYGFAPAEEEEEEREEGNIINENTEGNEEFEEEGQESQEELANTSMMPLGSGRFTSENASITNKASMKQPFTIENLRKMVWERMQGESGIGRLYSGREVPRVSRVENLQQYSPYENGMTHTGYRVGYENAYNNRNTFPPQKGQGERTGKNTGSQRERNERQHNINVSYSGREVPINIGRGISIEERKNREERLNTERPEMYLSQERGTYQGRAKMPNNYLYTLYRYYMENPRERGYLVPLIREALRVIERNYKIPQEREGRRAYMQRAYIQSNIPQGSTQERMKERGIAGINEEREIEGGRGITQYRIYRERPQVLGEEERARGYRIRGGFEYQENEEHGKRATNVQENLPRTRGEGEENMARNLRESTEERASIYPRRGGRNIRLLGEYRTRGGGERYFIYANGYVYVYNPRTNELIRLNRQRININQAEPYQYNLETAREVPIQQNEKMMKQPLSENNYNGYIVFRFPKERRAIKKHGIPNNEEKYQKEYIELF